MTPRLLVLAALAVLPLLAQAQTPTRQPAATAPAAQPAAPATEAIGEVTLVTGAATAVAAGRERALHAGDPVYQGETITTGPNSYANLRFSDGGRILLRPATEFTVEAFRAAAAAPAAATATALAPQPTGGNAFFRLVRGGFRAVTGFIGKSDRAAYRVATPAATIGIRGTDYEVVTCADDCPAQARVAAGYIEVAASSLEGLQLAQAGEGGGGAGIIVVTNEGSIVLRTPRGETVVDVGQVAVALASGQTFMLPAVPDALLLNATPAPANCE